MPRALELRALDARLALRPLAVALVRFAVALVRLAVAPVVRSAAALVVRLAAEAVRLPAAVAEARLVLAALVRRAGALRPGVLVSVLGAAAEEPVLAAGVVAGPKSGCRSWQ